jgi:hypothetical protein
MNDVLHDFAIWFLQFLGASAVFLTFGHIWLHRRRVRGSARFAVSGNPQSPAHPSN